MSSRLKKAIFIIIAILVVLTPFIMEFYTAQPDFCGSCHIMKKYHLSWQDSKHNDIACVPCH